MEKVKQAYKIAKRDLRACYAKYGIYAGAIQFDDYWARDSLYASLGALKIGDKDIVKKNLSILLKYQQDNGQIPLRVGDYFLLWKILGIHHKKKIRAKYMEDKCFSIPRDQNSLFLITFREYIKHTKDVTFLKKNIKELEKAIQWNFLCDKDDDLLMEGRKFSTWADSIKKYGKVHYTNVLHCEALSAMSYLYNLIGNKEQSLVYNILHKKVNDKNNKLFWNGKYFIDWINKKEHNYFSTDGNVLAILFGHTTKEQAKKIQDHIKKSGINKGTPSLTNYPPYPLRMLSLIDSAGGIHDHHNGIRWLWLGCMDAVAKDKSGMKKEAKQLMLQISEVILRHGEVYETYEPDGRTVKRFIFKSEHPFAWSAGLFIYAVHELKLIK